MSKRATSKKLRSLPAESLQESEDVEIDIEGMSDSPTIKTEKLSPTRLLSLANMQRDEGYLNGRTQVITPIHDSLDESLQKPSFTKLLQEADEELMADSEWVSALSAKMMDLDSCTKQSLPGDITDLLYQYVKEKDRDNSKSSYQGHSERELPYEEINVPFQPLIHGVRAESEGSTAIAQYSSHSGRQHPPLELNWHMDQHQQLNDEAEDLSQRTVQNAMPSTTEPHKHQQTYLRDDVPLLPAVGTVDNNAGCEEYDELYASHHQSTVLPTTSHQPSRAFLNIPATSTVRAQEAIPMSDYCQIDVISLDDDTTDLESPRGIDGGRNAHNAKERVRRARIKNACEQLRDLVPGVRSNADKATVLEQGVLYIRYLKHIVGKSHDKEFCKRPAKKPLFQK